MDFSWVDGALAPRSPGPAAVVLVSDSWLLDEGRVLAQDVHRERFSTSVAAVDPDLVDEAAAFWRASVLRLPVEGRWFPRLQLGAESADSRPGFTLTVRPAPDAATSVILSTSPRDPRLEPLTKGPDLARLEAVGAEARQRGADQAVLLSPSGLIVEGHYTSLVWWRGDALCVVDDVSARLPSVTERSLVTLASALGVEILRDETDPEGLDGLEVWALNSLHGARIATRWIDGPRLAERPGRLRLWRSRLDALRRPLR